MQEIILKTIFWKRIIKKLEKNNYFFVLMDKIYKNKGDLELVTGSSSGYKTSSEKFLY